LTADGDASILPVAHCLDAGRVKKAYWDRLAATFSDDVLEITDHDVNGVLERTARRLGDGRATAGDFGCGAGATTRLLARHFGAVVGVDFSPRLIDEAKRRTREPNVRYRAVDLAARARPSVRVDVGFCVNCLLSPEYPTRERIARHVGAAIRGKGPAVFVVPSFESILQTYQATIDVDVLQGAARGTSLRRTSTLAEREVRSLVEGIVEMGGEPTKHFLGDEITSFLEGLAFAVEALERVEYPWAVEFDLGSNPDAVLARLGRRKPWDWLVLARAPARASVGRRGAPR
jgi:SAM-dependent methyltransferase